MAPPCRSLDIMPRTLDALQASAFQEAFGARQIKASGHFLDLPEGLAGHRRKFITCFLPDVPRGGLRRLGSFSEADVAEDKAAIIQEEVEEAREAAEEAEEEAGEAEEAELIVVGIATVFTGVAWYTTYVTWQMYQRWLNMKKRTALCVGAARAANAVTERGA